MTAKWTQPGNNAVSGGNLTIANANTWIRDNSEWMALRESVRAYRDNNTNIANFVFEKILWGREDWDPEGWHSTTVNQDDFTPDQAAFCLFSTQITWEPAAKGIRRVDLLRNGSAVAIHHAVPPGGEQPCAQNTTTLIKTAATDTLEVQVRQTSGDTLQVLGADDEAAASWCELTLIGYDTAPTAWTEPPDFNETSLVNDTFSNNYIRDNMSHVAFRPCVRVTRAATQSIASSTWAAPTWAAISWDTEDFDNGGMWAAGQPTRITAPRDGLYMIGVQTVFAANVTGARGVRVAINGTDTNHLMTESAIKGGNAWARQMLYPWQATSGDYLELKAWQSSGAALDYGGAAHASLWGYWAGEAA